MAEQHQLKDVKNSDIALVPQPSDDINDPLNWPKWKKAAAFSCIVYFAMLGSWIMGGVVLGIPAIIQEFGITLNDAIDGLISWIVLTLGLGVLSPPIRDTELLRTSSGHRSRSTLASARSSSSSHSSPSQAQYGVPKHSRGRVWKQPGSSVPLRTLLARVFALELKLISSSSMNAVSGWEFTSLGCWVVSALAA